MCVLVQPLLDQVVATLPTPRGNIMISIDGLSGLHALTVPPDTEVVDVLLPLAAACASIREVTIATASHPTPLFHEAASSVRGPVRAMFSVAAARWERGVFDAYVRVSLPPAARKPGGGRGSRTEIRIACNQAQGVVVDALAPRNALEQSSTPFASKGVAAPAPAQGLYGAPKWDVPLVGSDSVTRGSWIGRYGRRGYKLFGAGSVRARDGSSSSSSNSSSSSSSIYLSAPWLAGVEVDAGVAAVVDAQVPPSNPRYASVLELPQRATPTADPNVQGVPRASNRTVGVIGTTYLDPMAIEVALYPPLLPRQPDGARCLNISLYLLDWTGTNVPVHGYGEDGRTQRATAISVFTVAPGVDIDVGYATAVLQHPALADGDYRTWRVCAAGLRTNTSGVAVVRFRIFVVTGSNAQVSAVLFD